MSIISIEYYIFLAITMLIYYVSPKKFKWTILLASTITFIISNSSVKLLGFSLLMIALTYISTMILANYKIKLKRDIYEKRAKIIVGLTVICEILILVILKNNAFFVTNFNFASDVLGLNIKFSYPQILAPIGVSYFALMLVGYLLDVHWDKIKVQTNPLKLVLFTLFFPQLISGPITRYNEMESSLLLGNRFKWKNIEFGCQRILWGFFKKLIVAERLSLFVTYVVNNSDEIAGSYIAVAIIAYTVQLYADFSASMDIVLGSAQIFGVKLPENFKNPFFAQNLSEFWRKWHITLGLWVKDYILYPFLKSKNLRKFAKFCKKNFGKKVAKQLPTYIGMFVVWFSVGFWHGGKWSYILGSGLFFFVLIVGGLIFAPITDKLITLFKINRKHILWQVFSSVRTFVLVVTCFFMGRVGSVTKYFEMLKTVVRDFNFSTLSDYEILLNVGLEKSDFFVLPCALLIMILLEICQMKFPIRETIAKQNLIIRWIIWYLLLFAVILFGKYGPEYSNSVFIYEGF